MIIKVDSYLFVNCLNRNLEKNIIKFKNLSIIYHQDNKKSLNEIQMKTLINFCKRKKIKFFFEDNIKLTTKYKADGLFLTSKNNKFYKNLNNKRILIIGSAHSQGEYFFKINQGCKIVMLSPLFNNKKYSINKTLGLNRFNLISRNWNCKIGALGGILKENLNKIYSTKIKVIGFQRLINQQL